MTILELYNKHKQGLVTKEKFLYEMRKDAQLPWINNLTSYSDAIQILMNKGIIVKSTSVNEGAFDDFKITHVDDPSYIEDPYGGEEYEDDEKDIDHNDDYDAWRDNQERDTDDEDNGIEEDYQASMTSDDVEGFIASLEEPITPTQLLAKYPGMHDANMYVLLVGLANAGKLVTSKGTPILASSVERIMDRTGDQAMMALARRASLNEQKDLNLEIDRLNPIIVAKAINSEIVQLPGQEANKETYSKIQKKVVNKLKKNPRAYDYLFITNSSEIEKADKTLEMQPVKKDNLKDKPNEMVKVKLKETILKMLREEHEIDYAPNNIVRLPEGGEGTIVEVKGGTLTIEMKDKTKKHYQMNVIKHANRPEAMEEESTETKEEEPKDELMEKIKNYLRALKKKKMDEEGTTGVSSTNVQATKDSIKGNKKLTSAQQTDLINKVKPGATITTP